MIQEDYVSSETAKLLKEKGFDENCAALYDLRTGEISQQGVGYVFNNSQWENFITAPTLQMAMKWLREEHSIAINIGWGEVFEDKYRWWCIILNCKNGDILRESEYYKTYEEACEAAIKYCLENLI